MEFEYFIDGERRKISVKPCVSIWSKLSGLMFKLHSEPLLFIFKRNGKLSIHSFFCKPFVAVWIDDRRNATKVLYIDKPWISFSGKGKYLLEIPTERLDLPREGKIYK